MDAGIVGKQVVGPRMGEVVGLASSLGPFQMLLHSCAEPNSIRFDFGATADSDGVLESDFIWEGHGKQFSMRKYAF